MLITVHVKQHILGNPFGNVRAAVKLMIESIVLNAVTKEASKVLLRLGFVQYVEPETQAVFVETAVRKDYKKRSELTDLFFFVL